MTETKWRTSTDVSTMLRRVIGEHVQLRLALQPDLGKVLADPGQLEQVPPLLRVHPQRSRDRLEHLHGGVDVASLLQPGVPGDAHPGGQRDFFAAQPTGAHPGHLGKPQLGARRGFPACTEERAEGEPLLRALVHSRQPIPGLRLVVPVLASAPSSLWPPSLRL